MSITSLLTQYHIPFVRIESSAELARITCPKCSAYRLKSDVPCLSIYKTQKWKCHHCGIYGKYKDLLELLKIKDIYNLEITQIAHPRKIKYQNPLPENIVPAHKNKKSLLYLTSRGLSISTIKKFALLYCEEGFYAERIIIPLFDRKGTYRSWVSRSIHSMPTKKYLYPKHAPIAQLLYNLHEIRHTNSVWIVEGVFDVIHCYPHAVASFSKFISDMQIMQLRTHGITKVYLMWDTEAWQEARKNNNPTKWEKAVEKLNRHFFTFPVQLPHDTPTEYSLNELKQLCEVF